MKPLYAESVMGSSRHGFDWRLFRRLFSYTRPYAAKRRIVFLTTAIRAFQRPFLFWALAAIVNGPIAHGDYRSTLLWTSGYLVLAAFTGCVAHLRSRHQNELGELIVHDLRDDLFTNLQRQPISFYHKTKLGRILSRIVSDLEAVRRGVQLVVFIAQEFLQLAICGGLMLYYNWLLFLVILGFAPVLVWSNRHFHPRLRRLSFAAAESGSHLTGVLAEAVRGIRVIQGFTRQGRGEEAFGAQAGRLASDNVKLGTESALYAPLLGLTGQFFLAAMLLVGSYGVIHHLAGLNIQSLVAYFFLPTSFFLSLQAAASYYPQILAAQVGGERVLEFIDLKPEWADDAAATDIADPRATATPAQPVLGAHVEFRDVTFGYAAGRPVLHAISFIANPGQTVALVGHTGSGKSTIINLVAKFYPPTSGEVFIDGRGIRTITAGSLRRQLGLVLQANFLFSGSVLENIRFGRPEATDAEVVEVTRRLDCLDLLEGLPLGLKTEVKEGGANLSLGQRQVVCFARALLADPRILILDEATSAVDAVTEVRLQRALGFLLAGRTSFVIAHRLSTIRNADQILVIDHGRILERGTHRELIAHRGAYWRLAGQSHALPLPDTTGALVMPCVQAVVS